MKGLIPHVVGECAEAALLMARKEETAGFFRTLTLSPCCLLSSLPYIQFL
jgi:hypothetical protein